MTARLIANNTISLLDSPVERLPTWQQWVGLGMRKMRHDMILVTGTAARWAERACERRRLLTFDDRMLKDIGLSRADAWAEAAKPVWRP